MIDIYFKAKETWNGDLDVFGLPIYPYTRGVGNRSQWICSHFAVGCCVAKILLEMSNEIFVSIISII